MKVANLPYNTTYEDIEGLFAKYSMIQRSAVIGERLGGQRSGYACVLCETED